MRRVAALLFLVLGSALLASPASAAEVTEVATALDEDNPWDLILTVGYEFQARQGAIKREHAGATTGGPVGDGVMPVVKDLVFNESRHIITPRLAIGIFHDFELSAALPITLNYTHELSFDQREDNCIYPGGTAEPTCINRDNSTTLLDALLPNGATGGMGYNADDPGGGFPTDSSVVFRSVARGGLDQVRLGARWAALSQKKDDTKPTWTIGGELRLAVGKVMRFNRNSPSSEDGVGRGVHEVRVETSISKRTTWAEPYVTFYWMTPVGLKGGDTPEDPDGTQFWDVSYGQKRAAPQQYAGALFGFEAIAWENKIKNQRLALELQGNLEGHFEGQAYSEMWEVFAYAGDRHNNPTGPLVLDANPTDGVPTPLSHPGVTDEENHLRFAGRLGVRGQVGEHVRFGAGFEIGTETRHSITVTDAGEEFPACSTGANPCETVNDDLVTPGTAEVNPLYDPVIDMVGRRYLVDETISFAFLVNATFIY